LVDTSGSNSGYVAAEIQLADSAATYQALQTGEKLLARVLTAPVAETTTATSDILVGFAATKTGTGSTLAIASYGTGTGAQTAGSAKVTAASAATGATFDLDAFRGDGDVWTTTYLLGIQAASNKALDQGTYTIGLYLLDANDNTLSSKTISFKTVSDKILSGAVLTGATGGVGVVSATFTGTRYNYVTATLTDANGGDIREGANVRPAISASAKDASTTAGVATGGSWTAADDGTTGYDASAASLVAMDGVYDVSSGSALTSYVGTHTVTLRYGNASSTAKLSVINAATGTVSGQSVSATGASVLTPAATTPWTTSFTQYIPLTTTSATATWSGGTAGQAYSVTVTWVSASSAGDVTPKSATPQIIYADASGKISVPVTAASPIDGTKATASIVGLGGTPGDIVMWWVKSKTSAVSVSMNGAGVALKSANTFTATATDNFGSPVVGAVLQPAVTGSNADATTRATVVTDAKGQASITLTDALAVAAGTDTVKFTDVSTTIAGSAKVTYAATAPVTTSLTAFYTVSASTVTGTAISTAVPSTGIYADAATTKFAVKIARDNTKATSVADTAVSGTPAVANNDQLAIRIVATAEGVAVAATASTGAYILNSANLQASSRTQYTSATTFDKTFIVGSNVAGANTITFKSGDVTTAVSFWTGTTTANARFVTLTGAATGAANGDPIAFTAKVTDRYGNAISGATLTIAATGVGVMLGGATIQSYTTDSTGTFTFQGTSLVANGGTGTFTVTATNTADYASAAGKVGSSSVDSTLAAGNSSAKVDVVFAAGNNGALDAAQAASDAASEATDAANAATDAANAAAEAADAATAAAQDAADAVAALSTQVSEMVNALKKQITALTNLVIKIQKKVKA
jgi:hypothetical protein